jgi:hypothetical protein
MVVVVVALAVSLALVIREAGCFQDSISAYYYTAARSVFVGAMIAIGVSLIVIKGATVFEDACLNVAGLLAPVVAFVPTTEVGACNAIPAQEPIRSGPRAADFVAAVDNNITAMVVAGAVALAIGVVIHSIEAKDVLAVLRKGSLGTRIGYWFMFAILLVGAGALLWDRDLWYDAHGRAAVAMFGFLAAAALGNGLGHVFGGPQSRYWLWYLVVGVLMPAAGLLMLIGSWPYRVFAVEAIEITLFVVFWLIQSLERWHWMEPAAPQAA